MSKQSWLFGSKYVSNLHIYIFIAVTAAINQVPEGSRVEKKQV